jgi:hypothetical protein
VWEGDRCLAADEDWDVMGREGGKEMSNRRWLLRLGWKGHVFDWEQSSSPWHPAKLLVLRLIASLGMPSLEQRLAA